MRAAADATAMIDFLAIALSLPNALLNLGKSDSFPRNESSRPGLNLSSVTKFASCRGITDFPCPSHCPAGNRWISLRDAGTYYRTTKSRARHAGMQAADHARALARNEERVFDSLRKTATCRRSNKWPNRLVSTSAGASATTLYANNALRK
jgi:hypothetical protein